MKSQRQSLKLGRLVLWKYLSGLAFKFKKATTFNILMAGITILLNVGSTALAQPSRQASKTMITQQEKIRVVPISKKPELIIREALPINQDLIIKQLQDRYNSLPEGPRTGGGGNSIGSNFSDVAVKALENAAEISPSLNFENNAYDVKKLLTIARKMKVYVSRNSLILRGRHVEAINYPIEQVVVIQEQAWQLLNEVEKSRLAVHEVLGLSGIEDRNYEISRMLTKQLQNCRTSGCDARRNAKTMAVMNLVLGLNFTGDFNDDFISCNGFDDLYSFEKITDDTFKLICGNGEYVETAIVKVMPKTDMLFGDPDEYEVEIIHWNRK